MNAEYYQVCLENRKNGIQEISQKIDTFEKAKNAKKKLSKYYDDLFIIAKIK